jgi:hypothetical protein
MPVFLFPSPTTRDEACPLCRRAIASHAVQGRGFRCTQDVVIGADQCVSLRRERLAQLQTRVLKVSPWAIDVPQVEARS